MITESEWLDFTAPNPKFLGVSGYDVSDHAAIKMYLDWTALFKKWEFPEAFPEVLNHEVWRGAAKDLMSRADQILNRLMSENLLAPRVVFGVWKASREGDGSIAVQMKDLTVRVDFTVDHLTHLARFIKPKVLMEQGETDYIGGFAISLGSQLNERISVVETDDDDINQLLTRDVCIMYLNAISEFLHYRVRRQEWGYCDDDDLSNDEVLRDLQPGIKVTVDRTLREQLLRLLGEDKAQDLRPEHFQYCGFYFANPKARNN